jgi:PAS domain S-box-containing protein
MDSHENLIKEIHEQLKPVLDHSDQAMYVYLDDEHKLCNTRFAELLGYTPAAWAAVKEPFTAAFVAEESQEALVEAFQNAMQSIVASSIEVTWKSQSGAPIITNVILVPMACKGHLYALHFIALL